MAARCVTRQRKRTSEDIQFPYSYLKLTLCSHLYIIDSTTDYRAHFDYHPLLCPCVLCIDERLQVGSH